MTATTTTSPAAEMLAEAKRLGFTVTANRFDGGDFVITVERRFAPGDVAAFNRAESDARELLGFAPMTYPGTVWGTDGRSVGGHAGLTAGEMRLSKSGVGARFGKAALKAGARSR